MGSLYLGGPTLQEVNGKMMMGLSIYGVAVISVSLYSRFYGMALLDMSSQNRATVHVHNAPINVSPHPPLQGKVRQSWGFDLIRIQLPHPPGNVRIHLDWTRTACVSHAHFSDSISRPLGQACHSKQGKFPTLSRVGGVGSNIDRRIIQVK